LTFIFPAIGASQVKGEKCQRKREARPYVENKTRKDQTTKPLFSLFFWKEKRKGWSSSFCFVISTTLGEPPFGTGMVFPREDGESIPEFYFGRESIRLLPGKTMCAEGQRRSS